MCWRTGSTHYRKNGKPTTEAGLVRLAMRPLVRLFGTMRACEFSPLKLEEVRETMIRKGLVRASINRHIGRIVRMFKWGVSRELVSVDTWRSLTALSGLRKGRSDCPEPGRVQPVSVGDVEAIRGHVSEGVWGLVRFQLHTGCRPGEALAVRGCDLDTTIDPWAYVPESHKTEHHGRERVIYCGPKARSVLRDYLRPRVSDFLFSPNGGGKPYTIHGLESAIRRQFGIDAAAALLGHADTKTTLIYAERDEPPAREAVERLG